MGLETRRKLWQTSKLKLIHSQKHVFPIPKSLILLVPSGEKSTIRVHNSNSTELEVKTAPCNFHLFLNRTAELGI